MTSFVAFDLDDTLYKEIDYVESAYKYIANFISLKYNLSEGECYSILQSTFNPFEKFSEYIHSIGGTESLQDFLDIYRTHFPKIKLDKDVIDTLFNLKNRKIHLGIITDGRQLSQMNKIKALNLDKFLSDTNIIISEAIGVNKYYADGFQLIMNRNPNCSKFYYIADNTSKDFYWPNKLGWTTICIKDNGQNIHKQNFDVELEYKPQHIIHNFSDIISLIK